MGGRGIGKTNWANSGCIPLTLIPLTCTPLGDSGLGAGTARPQPKGVFLMIDT